MASCRGQDLNSILKASMTANFTLNMLSLLQAEGLIPKYNFKKFKYKFSVLLSNSDQVCHAAMACLDPGIGDRGNLEFSANI